MNFMFQSVSWFMLKPPGLYYMQHIQHLFKPILNGLVKLK